MKTLLFAMLLLSPLCAVAATYKCQDASGRYAYSDRPCTQTQTAVGAPKAEAESAPAAPKPAAPYRRPAPVTVLQIQKAELYSLPKDEQGRAVLGANPASRIAIDPARRNPVNFLAACSVMITRCHTSGAGELDACVMSAPRCKSPKPWEEASTELCCPAECWRQYEARRLAGVAPQAAFDMAMYGTDGGDTCVPLK